MKEKYLLIALAATAVLAGCKKGNLPDRGVAQPIIFTATAEDNVETRTTFNPTDRRIFWEAGDGANINGYHFTAQNAGASTTFIGYDTEEVRPAFVSSQSGGFDGQKPQMLVDDKGTETKWCANNNHKGGSAWTIIVSTKNSCQLQAIKIWNGEDTESFSGRRWKNVTVSGSASANGAWVEIASFQDLNLATGNKGLAGTLNVNATASYQYYKIEISAIVSGDTMQMSDMKFDIIDKSKPLDIISPYTAYFPETLYNNDKPTLPSSVSETWAEGRFNMPMYAYSTSKNLQFKNLCGILKVMVKNDQLADVRHITVSSSNCATSGAFTVSDNKAVLTSPSATANTITINYTASVPTSSEGTVFYVPIPAQTYRDLKISVGGSSGLPKIMTTKKDKNIVVERNKIYTIDFAGSEPPVPAGALPGQYSVSPTKKVYFSKGNLQATYNGTNYDWDFAVNQYDYIGDAPGNKTIDSQTAGAVVDLFGWSTSGTNYGINTSTSASTYSGEFVDWGNAYCQSKGISSTTWRTLSTEEWQYLFNYGSYTSEVRNGKYKTGVTVCGKKRCVVIVPDGWDLSANPLQDEYSSSSSPMTWEKAEAAGAVCLPVAGYRTGSRVFNVGDYGYYPSSTACGSSKAYYVRFRIGEVSPGLNGDRYFSYSVRLITECQ